MEVPCSGSALCAVFGIFQDPCFEITSSNGPQRIPGQPLGSTVWKHGLKVCWTKHLPAKSRKFTIHTGNVWWGYRIYIYIYYQLEVTLVVKYSQENMSQNGGSQNHLIIIIFLLKLRFWGVFGGAPFSNKPTWWQVCVSWRTEGPKEERDMQTLSK